MIKIDASMNPITYPLDPDQSMALLKTLSTQGSRDYSLDTSRNTLLWYGIDHHKIMDLQLPWYWPPLKDIRQLESYLDSLKSFTPSYLILLIQAGQSALGMGQGEELTGHKVISKYMVRKKQGKAQITYLHQKGKSRAGSRIRLAQTVIFFEEINRQLQEWFASNTFERILVSCPPRLWGLLYQSRIQPPFVKKDDRLLQISVDVRVPRLAELQRIHHLARKGYLRLWVDAAKVPFFSIIEPIVDGTI